MDVENLKEEASRYALTIKLLNFILNDLKQSLIANSDIIMNANKEDVKVNKRQIKIVEFINIVDSYRKNECILNDDERKIVIYKGDPYVTLHLCLQAITQRTKILLVQEDFLYGVNEILLKIVNNVLKEYKITNLINKISYQEFNLAKIKNHYDGIVVIGDTTIYQKLKSEENIKFYPYNNIALYCDSEELLKLQEAIYIYANENEYEIEILYDENLDEVIEEINADDWKNIAILLTKNTANKEKFKDKVKNKEIFVNENPFKQEVGIIYNYLK